MELIHRHTLTSGLTLLLLSFFILIMPAPAAAAENEAAGGKCDKELAFDLPYGEKLAFCAVWLNLDGTKVFDSRLVKLGQLDGGGGYDQQPYTTRLSGAFTDKRNGKDDWFYYLGETEVSRAQYNAVMRWEAERKKLPPPPEDKSRLPQTGLSVAGVFAFTEALNAYLHSTQKAKLPKWRGAVGFCRLPTEGEWEFAARGGIVTGGDHHGEAFERPNPYPKDRINDYEANKDSSGGAVKECGSYRPNPLGLYDMLGNVREMTVNLFTPDYTAGRFGGFVVRGGHAADEEELSASARREMNDDYTEQVGFRLAMSTRISQGAGQAGWLNEAYDEYRDRVPDTVMNIGTGSMSPSVQDRQKSRMQTESILDKTKAGMKKLEEEKRAAENKWRNAEDGRTRAEADLAAAKRKIDSLTAEVGRKQATAGADGAAAAETRQLRQQLADKGEELVAARQRADSLAGVREALEKELERKKNEAPAPSIGAPTPTAGQNEARLQAQIDSLKKDLRSAEERCLEAKKEQTRLADELTAAQRKSEALNAELQAKNSAPQLTRDDRDAENARLRQTIADRERDAADARVSLNRLVGEKSVLEDQLAKKDQEIADGRSLALSSVVSLDDSGKRLRYAESQYLEALLHEASAWASLAYLRLWMVRTALEGVSPDVKNSKDIKAEVEKRMGEATDLLKNYCVLIRNIVDDTNKELFDGVKDKLIRDGQGFTPNEQKRRRQALEYITAQVTKIRGGGAPYPKAERLVETILEDPAFASP